MKRILSMLLVLLLACTQFIGVTFATNAPAVTIDSVEAAAGETVDVYVSIADNGVAIRNYGLAAVTYDTEALTLVSGEDLKLNGPLMSSWDGSAYVAQYSSEQSSCSGQFLKLTFKVSESVSWGTFAISATASVNGSVATLNSGSIVVPGPEVTIDKNVTVKPGETADVYVSIADNGVAIRNYGLAAVTYDTEVLTLVSGEDLKLNGPLMSSWDSSAYVAQYSSAQSSCSGQFLKLTFKANENAPEATYTISATASVNGTVSVVNVGSIVVKKETVELVWPAADIAEEITYGQTLADAFVGFPKAGTVKIDGVDYAGQFEVTAPETAPNAGTFEAKLTFKVTADGDHKDRVFDADGYYLVTVNAADYEGTITAANQEATYTGQAIDYTGELSYNEEEVVPGEATYSADPVNVGTYTVTIPFTSLNANYGDPEDVTATLEIKKAVADDRDDIVIDTLTAESVSAISSVEELLAEIELDLGSTVEVTFGDGLREELDVTWTAKEAEWNVKGGDYEFIPTIASDNLDLTNVSFKGIAKIAAVNGTLAVENLTKTVSKASAESVVGLEDLGIPTTADLTIASAATPVSVNLVWTADKTLEEAIAEVTETENGVITYTLDVEETLAEYAWLTVSASATAKITITDKFAATIAAFEAPDGVYGTELETIELTEWTPEEGELDEEATIKITYIGRDGTEYAESEVKPTLAGKYTAVATLVSATHSGQATSDFEIAKKEITYTVANAERAYGEENPDFTGEVTDGEIVGEDDLGITFTCEAVKGTAAGTADIAINAAAANANYDVTIVPGVLTITKAALPEGIVPVIKGEAKVGIQLEAELAEIAGGDGIVLQWYVDGEAVAEAVGKWYLVNLTDSNKEITVKAVTTEETVNYTGETVASEAVLVEKYEISGIVVTTLTPEGTIAVDTVVTADVTGISNYEDLGLTYQWYLDDEAIEGATEATYTIIEGNTGLLSVTVTPSENFAGSISATAGEIGKAALPATITLTTEGDIAVDSVITAVIEGATEADYDLVWLVDGVASEVTGGTYTVTAADYGKTISAKLVAKGETYTGEVVSSDVYTLAAIAPANVAISTSADGTSITATFTADANGSLISRFEATITDGADYTETVNVPSVNGVFTYKFEGLAAGITYTITAVAVNSVGESAPVTATATAASAATGSGGTRPSTSGNTGTTVKPQDPETPGATTNVTVESKTETAVVGSKDLAGKETVSATVTTDSGDKVDVTVDVKDKAVDSLTVTADKAEAEVAGKVAEGLVGEAIEVKVDAKSGKDAVEVGVTVAISSEAPAYAYAVDELGNTVRLDSTYDAEAGKVIVENVADGTVVAVSTAAPVDFADVEGRWSEAEVNKAADLGIVSGRGAGSYAPSALLTRSETNKLKKNLAEVLKLALPVNADIKIDTAPDHWAYESDLWAAQTGITTGTGVNEDGAVVISGDDNVVRQDYVTLIARMIKLALGDVAVEGEAIQFADAADVADYAAEAFNLLSAAGILKGSEGANGVVANPKANITREEAAALSNRAYEFVKSVKIAK